MPATVRACTLLSLLALAAWSLASCGGATGVGDARCSYAGHTYAKGERFPSTDGCNTCTCEADGNVACTLLGCETCNDVLDRYSAALNESKVCDPKQSGQCTKLVTEGLACGCQTFVNAEKTDALSAALDAQQTYATMKCGEGIVCGPCRTPTGAYCSSEGRCEPLFDDGRACKANGIVYPDGATGIADPVSCNECQCQDGALGCTEIACPKPCPAGTSYATQCAQCGPTDACLIVEHACLPTCTDTCKQGPCIDGICKNVCG